MQGTGPHRADREFDVMVTGEQYDWHDRAASDQLFLNSQSIRLRHLNIQQYATRVWIRLAEHKFCTRNMGANIVAKRTEYAGTVRCR